MSRRSSTIQDLVSALDVLEQEVRQLQIDYHSLSARVNQILDILIQLREAMHQQHDELDAIRSQVEQLQIQRVSSPLALVDSPSSSGSSPTTIQSIFDLNQPTQEEEMEDEEPSQTNQPVVNVLQNYMYFRCLLS
jgi:septal ring factor EnvC (AmiA/AmiB activator)